MPSWSAATLSLLAGVALPLMAAVLPEDRADSLYHSYDGGGMEIDGPSILLRKSIGTHVSVSANYYQDAISSASIDVLAQGSPYTEVRDEYRVGMDMLYDNTTISLGYVNSEENDYSADTYALSVDHTLFGDLTTVGLTFVYGDDVVRKNQRDPTTKEIIGAEYIGDAEHRRYKVSMSQILTKNLIVGLAYEGITDEGYLKNPYRSAYTSENGLDALVSGTPENYPETRTSSTIGLRANYFLPWRAALHSEYKYFEDTWEIKAHKFKISYIQPIKSHWDVDVYYSFYKQDGASFYDGMFNAQSQNNIYTAGDKELSTFNTQGFGFGIRYEFLNKGWWQFDKGSLNFAYERIDFDYADYYQYVDSNGNRVTARDAESTPYAFSANVYQFYISLWY